MKYIFVSPHIDDAILSAGGFIQCNSTKLKIKIEYVFSISNWTNPESITSIIYPPDEGIVSPLRKHEEACVAKLLQYEYSFLDFLDYPLRTSPSATIGEIETHLANAISRDSIYFFPAGIEHPDHVLLKEIGLDLLTKGNNIIFYEDMPYVARNQENLDALIDSMHSFGFCSKAKEINFARKKEALNEYGSQISTEWLDQIEKYSYDPQLRKYFEYFWSAKELLCHI